MHNYDNFIPSPFKVQYSGKEFNFKGGGGWGREDLDLNKVKFSRSPFECYFTEVIPLNNFWWLSRSPPHVFIFQGNLSGPPSEFFQSFQRYLPLKSSPSPTQAINNDRSLVKWRSCLGQGHIFLDFYCLQVLDPEKANFVWKHVSKPLCKQLIDCAKPDDVHLPFQQFLLITILIYTETFQPKLTLSKGQFFYPFFNKAIAPGMSSWG